MMVSFLRWAMEEFNGYSFGICGKTVQSVERNIITPLLAVFAAYEEWCTKESLHALRPKEFREAVTQYLGGSSYDKIAHHENPGTVFINYCLTEEAFRAYVPKDDETPSSDGSESGDDNGNFDSLCAQDPGR